MTDAPSRILVADDDPDIVDVLVMLLRGAGHEADAAASPGAVVEAVRAGGYDAVLMDMNYSRDTTGGVEGLDLLVRLRALDDTLPVVVMTAWGSIAGAVEALRRGARDYVGKPFENAQLLRVIATQVAHGRAVRDGDALRRAAPARRPGMPTLIAGAPAMQPVLRLMERVGPSSAHVLITGEHGTGKEVVARWLHAASPRATRPMVTVNLAGLADGVFESELFGHERGAFTDARAERIGRFELADGGTLFLDEVTSLGLAQQAKLLRVLQAGEFERVGASASRRADVRVIAATNADVGREVAEGRFRADLYYRLNTVELHLPPLRERREDILPLAMHYLRDHAARYRRPATAFDAGAARALAAHPWPGNVRELGHVVERAVLLADDALVTSEDLNLRVGDPGQALEAMSLDEVERVLVAKALERHAGNVSLAAQALGLSRSALYRRLQRHGL